MLVIGAGGHACSMVDAIESMDAFQIAGFIGKKKTDEIIYRNYRVIGTDDELKKLYDSGIHYACIGIGYLGKSCVREKIFFQLKEIGYQLPNIVDSTAILAKDVRMGEGNFVGKGSVLNSNSRIGNATIINTGAIIEHGSVIGDFTHVAVGAVVCGAAGIGARCFIGAGAIVLQGIQVRDDVIVAANDVVRKDKRIMGERETEKLFGRVCGGSKTEIKNIAQPLERRIA